MPDFVPKYLTAADVSIIAGNYLREVEMALLKELFQTLAQAVVGGNMIGMQHAETLVAALEVERDRLVRALSPKEGG